MSASSAPAADGPVITVLPQYFPTSCKKCKAETEEFFTCFEKFAVMRDSTDTQSARESLLHCQPQLKAYMSCMDKNMNQTKKPWWRII